MVRREGDIDNFAFETCISFSLKKERKDVHVKSHLRVDFRTSLLRKLLSALDFEREKFC